MEPSPQPEPEPVTELRRGRLWRRAPPPKPSPHPGRGAASPPAGAAPPSPLDHPPNPNAFFSCNICLDAAKDPVVTLCGHLFCWRCLYRWVHCHSPSGDCPVCKSSVDVHAQEPTVVPIYGPDPARSTPEEDNDNEVPPRPAGRRTDPGLLVGDVIEEVRRTAEVFGARVQLQALRRTTTAIDRVLASLQAIEDIVVRLRVIHREAAGSGMEDQAEDAEEDGVYRRTRRRLAAGRR